ncbi:MAG: RIP metalloprotease RseP, partial [Alphaproteobacteria bacterium]|nr:RIP metalloprotease RseP [Alphaproteobacteria bacterium]
KVFAFSIGMGPELYGWTDKHGTRWRLAALPIGGYVQVLSELGGEKITQKDKKKTVESKKLWQKMWFTANGIIMNFALAFVLIFGIFATKGLPQDAPVVDTVIASSPAEKGGILKGDEVLMVAGKKVKSFADIRKHLMTVKTDKIPVEIKRNNKKIELTLTPENKEGIPTIGIQARPNLENAKKVDIGTAAVETVKEMGNSVITMFRGLGQIVSGKRSSKELGGMISIAQMSGKAFENGFFSFLFFLAFISINLGVINLFPIPGLDGGHLVFYIYELIIRRPAPKLLHIGLTYAGFGLLIFSMIFSTYNDILRLL